MKCKGMIKEKTNNGRTVERKCNNPLPDEAIYCDLCGQATEALKTGLNAKGNLKAISADFAEVRSNFYKFNIFYILTIILPIGLIIFFQNQIAHLIGVDQYLFINLAMLIFVPFALVPFAFTSDNYPSQFTINNYMKSLRSYPQLFLFTLISILFFLLLKILCTGYLINVVVDPILHPVRLILVLHWLTIMFVAPLVIIRKEVNAFQAIKICYIASAETRWQQFSTLALAVITNLGGLVVFGVGLLRSISFSFLLIERYYKQMDQYKLFNISGE